MKIPLIFFVIELGTTKNPRYIQPFSFDLVIHFRVRLTHWLQRRLFLWKQKYYGSRFGNWMLQRHIEKLSKEALKNNWPPPGADEKFGYFTLAKPRTNVEQDMVFHGQVEQMLSNRVEIVVPRPGQLVVRDGD